MYIEQKDIKNLNFDKCPWCPLDLNCQAKKFLERYVLANHLVKVESLIFMKMIYKVKENAGSILVPEYPNPPFGRKIGKVPENFNWFFDPDQLKWIERDHLDAYLFSNVNEPMISCRYCWNR